ncbi:MAG: CaiB/BaiF CoA transferase family protein [Gammaproteobacteria bacterium]
MNAPSESLAQPGPLDGVLVIEMGAIGPVPLCGMLLADLGAEVIRIDRLSSAEAIGSDPASVNGRGKKSIALDLKKAESIQAVCDLAAQADMLIEGFRPGVMERLGLGPEVLCAHNRALVYGRMTGWGQSGPLSQAAGHDLNYIALTGALGAMGRAGQPPHPPLNLIGDYGGGALFLAFGALAALLHARQSGQGQVVDSAMTEGTASLMSMIYGMHAMGVWRVGQNQNLLDGAAHFYDTYACSDGRYISLGAIEPQFYQLMREKMGLEESFWDAQMDRSKWPEMKTRIAEVVAKRSQDEWCQLMEGTDVCFAPVLDMSEAPLHAHNQARQSFVPIVDDQGQQLGWQPAVAPRFSETPGAVGVAGPKPGRDTQEIIEKFKLAL